MTFEFIVIEVDAALDDVLDRRDREYNKCDDQFARVMRDEVDALEASVSNYRDYRTAVDAAADLCAAQRRAIDARYEIALEALNKIRDMLRDTL